MTLYKTSVVARYDYMGQYRVLLYVQCIQYHYTVKLYAMSLASYSHNVCNNHYYTCTYTVSLQYIRIQCTQCHYIAIQCTQCYYTIKWDNFMSINFC